LLRTDRLPLAINGAGDLVAALFLFHFLATGSAPQALAKAGAALYGVLKCTADAQAKELRLVAAQAEIVAPSRNFAILQL
jgi:pyridoxine kinase